MVFPNLYCEKCGKQYENKSCALYEWCKPCQINNLRKNFINWTSGNEKIDKLIQEMQLKANSCKDIIFEWIPYDQFDDIKEEIFTEVYFATWKDGPLSYNKRENKYTKNQQNRRVVLKLYNLQNITSESLNEV